MIELSLCVQHHPLRAGLLPALLDRLGECEVVTDPEPEGERNPLRTYLECLRRTPDTATHRCVIQDDTRPCENFREKAEAALAERPNSIVCFFVPGSAGGGRNRVLRAAKSGERWAPLGLGGWVPVVATCFPREFAVDFVAYASERRFARKKSDDNMLTRFVRVRRPELWATVPSLVEHPDEVPSLIGRPHSAGLNRARVAALLEPSE